MVCDGIMERPLYLTFFLIRLLPFHITRSLDYLRDEWTIRVEGLCNSRNDHSFNGRSGFFILR